MKPVLRALVWLGLGGGIGFFAGWQFGEKRKEKELEDISDRIERCEKKNDLIEHNYDVSSNSLKSQHISEIDILNEKHRIEVEKLKNEIDAIKEYAKEALRAQREYLGKEDEEIIGDSPIRDEEPEMPMDEPEMPDDVLMNEDEDEEEEIPQLHPQDILPHAISKSEFLQNEGNYDVVDLDYYTDDDVIFDPKAEEKWTHPEQLLGIGWNLHFYSAHGKPRISEIFIQNDTMETLYRITRIDDSFAELYEEE